VGTYFVTCATTEACEKSSDLTHVTHVGLKGPEGARVVEVSVARLMISSGDTLTMGERGDDDAELRKGKCDACGRPTLRTRRSSAADIATVPACK
jgi:hypothetical protein